MGRRSDAKERLLKKAAELIPERGYTAIGVHELCEAAEVKPGSFYYLYPSKQQLVLDMLEQSWEQARQTILEPIAQAKINGLERINQFFLRTYEVQTAISQQHQTVLGCTFGSLGSEMATQDETIRQKVLEIFSAYIGYLETWLIEAIESGHSQVSREQARATAEALFAYYEGTNLLARVHKEAQFIQKLSVTALVLAEGKS